MCRIYLSGGIRGYQNGNKAQFDKYATQLRAAGHEVFSPIEHDLPNVREAFRQDTSVICSWADAIYLMPGWQRSRGARAELALAQALDDMEIVYLS